jgi:lon-related putative ATP-dependent protease
MQKSLNPADIRNECTLEYLAKIPEQKQLDKKIIIGQHRAVKALMVGLGMKAHGFNIYVAGSSGTGKLTAVTGFVELQAAKEPVPPDWCYVNNFKDPYRPNKLSLPPGTAEKLKKDMKTLVRDIYSSLVKVFESEDYAGRKSKLVKQLEEKQSDILGKISEMAEKESFIVKQTQTSIITIPVKDSKPLTDADFKNMSEAELDDINKRQSDLQEKIGAGLREMRKHEKDVSEKLDKLAKEVAKYAIDNLIEDIADDYKSMPGVTAYLASLREDIMDNLPEFLKSQNTRQQPAAAYENPFQKRYEVNVLVDNSATRGAPVIIERNPTYNNLLGRVEKESYMGSLITDFTMIRKGSLHSANGGYLIIRIEELVQAFFSWNGLKRALKNREIVIEEATDQLGYLTTRTLKPEPIPLNVKIILIGNPMFYYLLHQYDFDFKDLYKVKADFDNTMERTDEHTSDYLNFVASLCEREALLHPDDTGKAKVVEYGSRLADDQFKLSTRFGAIADIVREASFYAGQESCNVISGRHITKAIAEKVYRSNMMQDKITEMITNNQIFIDTTEKKVAQINGLAVLGIGDLVFGIPSRITCSVSLGKGEVITIEREAELSGPIHTKGVLILSGFLAGKFMYDKPLSISLRLVFEQSYSEIEGDSASSTELYAILSALSGLPIKQGIAVTGSVNQKGQIQPIGGVNEKIEGYFEVCRQIGLNGEQGVMVPASNVRNMMLKEEVVDAVRDGKFHIWAVDSIEDGIEVLTGVKAGDIGQKDTVYDLVHNTLTSFAEKIKSFSIPGGREQTIFKTTVDKGKDNPIKGK